MVLVFLISDALNCTSMLFCVRDTTYAQQDPNHQFIACSTAIKSPGNKIQYNILYRHVITIILDTLATVFFSIEHYLIASSHGIHSIVPRSNRIEPNRIENRIILVLTGLQSHVAERESVCERYATFSLYC